MFDEKDSLMRISSYLLKKNALCVLVLMMGAHLLFSQQESGVASFGPQFGSDGAPVEVDAQSLDYDKRNGRIIASGQVVIISGQDRLEADRVLVDVRTSDAYALGNVVLEREGQIIEGNKMHYNFRTRVSSLDTPKIEADPFRVKAERIDRPEDNRYILYDAQLTTCIYDPPHRHYHVRAKRLEIVPDEYLKARGAVWYFGRVPVMYVPYWRRLLHEDSGFRFYPGYESRWGAYLLSSYFHRITPNVKLRHHIDYRTERGVALGEDIEWRNESAFGKLSLYYADDQEPMSEDDPPGAPVIDPERYRIRLQHEQVFGPATRLLVRGEYVSDIDLRRDFFEDEYRLQVQPENYVSLTHQEDWFTLSGLINVRLNDFYSNVNRLPELQFNVFRRQIATTPFYYESVSSLANLERVFEERSRAEDYSALRFDTLNTVYYPTRIDGWLNVIPRAGYRGTYYSATKRQEARSEVVITTETNAVTGVAETVVTTNTSTVAVDAGAELRNVFSIGSEVSFKAFKRLPDSMNGQPWRHVVEPYLNYSFQLEPNVLPEELYAFDGVDSLDKVHQTLIGVRNLLQTKRNGQSTEVADVNLFTTLLLDPEDNQESLDIINMDSRFNPTPWMEIFMDGSFSTQESELRTYNTRFALNYDDFWKLYLEYRYRLDASSLFLADITYAPNEKWAFNMFSRYEFEESRLEEQGGYIQHNWDCLALRVGASVLPSYTRSDGTEEEADYRAMVQLWLTAFPEMMLGAR